MSDESDCRAVTAQVFRLLKEEREQRGLSKYALAAKSGLSQQAIGYIERGMTSPALETLLRMAKAMEVDLAVVLRKAQREMAKPETK